MEYKMFLGWNEREYKPYVPPTEDEKYQLILKSYITQALIRNQGGEDMEGIFVFSIYEYSNIRKVVGVYEGKFSNALRQYIKDAQGLWNSDMQVRLLRPAERIKKV